MKLFEKYMTIQKSKTACFSLALIVISSFGVLGQLPDIDSLKSLIERSEKDQIKIDALNELAFAYTRFDADSSIFWAKEAQALAKEVGYTRGEAVSFRMLGIAMSYESKLEEALLQYDQALNLFLSINDKHGEGTIYNNYGLIYQRLGRYLKSIESYSKSRIIAAQLNDQNLMSKTHNNLGMVLDVIGEYDSAFSHYIKSIELKNKPNDPLVGSTYTNLGIMKVAMGELEAAEEYYLKAMEIDVFHDDKWGIANGFENIGELHFLRGQYEEANAHFQKARNQFMNLKDKQRVAANDNFLGKVFFEKGNYLKALAKYQESLKICSAIGYQLGVVKASISIAACKRKMKSPKEAVVIAKKSLETAIKLKAYPEIVETTDILHKIYADLGDSSNAYVQAMKHMAFKDSLFHHERLKYVTQIEARHRLSQIQQQNELLTKENRLRINELHTSNLKIQRQNAIQFALIVCLMFAVITAIFWYRFNLKKQRTIKLLRQLNDEVIQQKEKIASQAQELEKVNAEMKHMNESLEVLVKERTQKIESQNQKLREYAFSNSHEVRAPLSNLLGLINVSKLEGMTPEELDEILEKIYISALDLDSVITKVNKILEEEGL